MENETYTLNIEPIGDHLQVTIPELSLIIETAPGEIKRDDAVDAAHRAITAYRMKQWERNQVRAS